MEPKSTAAQSARPKPADERLSIGKEAMVYPSVCGSKMNEIPHQSLELL